MGGSQKGGSSGEGKDQGKANDASPKAVAKVERVPDFSAEAMPSLSATVGGKTDASPALSPPKPSGQWAAPLKNKPAILKSKAKAAFPDLSPDSMPGLSATVPKVGANSSWGKASASPGKAAGPKAAAAKPSPARHVGKSN